MIVADTSVWIDYLRDRGTPQTERLEGLLGRRRLLLGDLIVCELLRGARDEGEAIRIGERLSPLPVAEMVGQRAAVQAALHFRILRRHGITIRNTVDLLIGTFCIADGHQLLHSDRDFKPMVEHLGLAEA